MRRFIILFLLISLLSGSINDTKKSEVKKKISEILEEIHFPDNLYARTGIKKGILTLNYSRKTQAMYGALAVFALAAAKLGAYSLYKKKLKEFEEFQKEIESLNLPSYREALERGADVAILKNGYYEEMNQLALHVLKEPTRIVEENFSPSDLRDNPILIIPSGGLFGLENPERLKAVLKDYVEQGGFLIVLSQMRGHDFECIPTPEGKPIKGYGWDEDASDFSDSVYVSLTHPSLSAFSSFTFPILVDGYFEEIPSNSTILLFRVKNSYPVAFMYPLEKGYILVTSTSEDYGYSNNKSTSFGRAFLRDLISWAKEVKELPKFYIKRDSAKKPKPPEVSLNIEVKNFTNKKASKVKFVCLDPDKKKVLDKSRPFSLEQKQSSVLNISFRLSFPLSFGIWHVDYILYDSKGEEVQCQAETNSGRFIIPISESFAPYQPPPYQTWITLSKSIIIQGERVTYRYHFKNNTKKDWKGNLEINGFYRTSGKKFQIEKIEEFSVLAKTEKFLEIAFRPAELEWFRIDITALSNEKPSSSNPLYAKAWVYTQSPENERK
jgi:hypothetical protein